MMFPDDVRLVCPEGHLSEFTVEMIPRFTTVKCLTCGATWHAEFIPVWVLGERQVIVEIKATRADGTLASNLDFPLTLRTGKP